MKSCLPFLAAVTMAAVSLPGALLATNYDEGIDGDLSNNMGAPTALALTSGANVLTATSVTGDVEYVAVTVPAGFVLQSVVLSAYSGTTKSFVGIQSGGTFTVPPSATTAAGLLGYTHFGVTGTPALLGTDILDDMGNGPGAAGFIPPLASGTYTFWLQETGATAVTYSLVLNTIPTPLAPILKVSGKTKIETSKSKLKFKGNVVGYATGVEYQIKGKGGFKPAVGVPKWTFEAKLKPGKNVIAIRAKGVGGTSRPTKVTVIRN